MKTFVVTLSALILAVYVASSEGYRPGPSTRNINTNTNINTNNNGDFNSIYNSIFSNLLNSQKGRAILRTNAVAGVESEKETPAEDDTQLPEDDDSDDDLPTIPVVEGASDASDDDTPAVVEKTAALPEMSAEQVQMFKNLIAAKAREIMRSRQQ